MGRHLVVLLDGTGNRFSHRPTNVLRLYDVLPKASDEVVTYYDQGVGTFGLKETLFEWQKLPSRLLGLAFGWGLRRNVEDAYRFLARSYQPGDSIYLFGFSRGAYAARALAALIHALGLVEGHQTHLFEYAWSMLIARDKAGNPDFGLQRNFKKSFGRSIKIRFVGLFDTVKSVGWIYDPVSIPYTTTNPSIQVVRHAVSIDERRSFFRQHLWSGSAKDLKEVWFAGVHSDIGGGYPVDDSRLALVPLRWMLGEASVSGLPLDRASVLRQFGDPARGPDPNADGHDSITTAWKFAEWLPRLVWSSKSSRRTVEIGAMPPFGKPRPRIIPQTALIHHSVDVRRNTRGDYAPSNVPQSNVAWINDDPSIVTLTAP